jgi:hypothetical protein
MNNFNDIRDSFMGKIIPLPEITLETTTVKAGLGMFLTQSICVGLWLSIKFGTGLPLLIPVSTFLQVGWLWSKVTESWKRHQQFYRMNNIRVNKPFEPQSQQPQSEPLETAILLSDSESSKNESIV